MAEYQNVAACADSDAAVEPVFRVSNPVGGQVPFQNRCQVARTYQSRRGPSGPTAKRTPCNYSSRGRISHHLLLLPTQSFAGMQPMEFCMGTRVPGSSSRRAQSIRKPVKPAPTSQCACLETAQTPIFSPDLRSTIFREDGTNHRTVSGAARIPLLPG